MKISYQWLLEYVDVDVVGLDVHSLGEALTMVGLAVELIEEKGEDFLLDIDVTSNRPDCLSHLGTAREIAAQYRLKLKKPGFEAPGGDESAVDQFPVGITIEDAALCPRYAGRVITDLVIGESPGWLKMRLESLGQRPINNIVDVTNYVLFSVGHPLHAFDYEKLSGPEIRVRRALPGEVITTLDGVKRELDPSILAICDGRKPVAVAGVMGGAESEISESTRTLLLESAYFEPLSIRAASKKLALSTEASYRFERGADPGIPVKALNMACRLIEEIGGGRFVSPVVDVCPKEYSARQIEIHAKRIEQVLGVAVPLDEATDILESLEFKIQSRDEESCQVEVPSFRGDVELEDDLVEEIARHYGYDRIPSRYPASSGAGHYSATEYHNRRLLEVLVGFGFYEAVNYSFTTPAREQRFLGQVEKMVEIANPLNEMGTHLRTTLIPGLVESVRYNLNHGNREVRLYEMGHVYLPESQSEKLNIEEPQRLGLAASGTYYSPYWSELDDSLRFLHLKGIIDALCRKVGLDVEICRADDISFLHPGISSEVLADGSRIGLLGELHPRIMDQYKFTHPVLVAELSLEEIYRLELGDPRHVEAGKFPSVEQDISFLVDTRVEFSKMRMAVQALGIVDLREFRLIDLYQGQNLPEDKLSVTVRLKFADPSRTLTQDEVNERSQRIFDVLAAEFGAESR